MRRKVRGKGAVKRGMQRDVEIEGRNGGVRDTGKRSSKRGTIKEGERGEQKKWKEKRRKERRTSWKEVGRERTSAKRS